MDNMTQLIHVERGGLKESAHCGTIVVTDSDGKIIAFTGVSDAVVFARSTAKPLQAVPLVARGGVDAYGFDERELAVMCSSHSGQIQHVEAVRSILHKCGLDEKGLRCGTHLPWDEQTAHHLMREGESASEVHNNCSGKHAGMLALCRLLGEDISTYMQPDHPVQHIVRETIADFCGVPASQLHPASDGCGLPVYAMPIASLAMALARFSAPGGDLSASVQKACGILLKAMAKFPEYVAGDERDETILMKATGSRFVAKSGAEGLMALMVPEKGWGVVIKMADGAARGLLPAAIETLDQLELLTEAEKRVLERYRIRTLHNWAGDAVGLIRPVFRLQ